MHCLISLGPGQNIDKIMMLLKGESSYWINKNKLFHYKFEWQDEYFAVSVSESLVNRVRNYIKNQENHHKKKRLMVNIKNLYSSTNLTILFWAKARLTLHRPLSPA